MDQNKDLADAADKQVSRSDVVNEADDKEGTGAFDFGQGDQSAWDEATVQDARQERNEQKPDGRVEDVEVTFLRSSYVSGLDIFIHFLLVVRKCK